MKTLIIGCNGFIGSYLCKEFESKGYELVRCDLSKDDHTVAMNILDSSSIQRVLEKYEPDVLINMAGQANVGLSWIKPQLTLELNTIGFVNLLEVVRYVNRRIRVIAVGSSDEYGSLMERGFNVTEDIPVNPASPYAISKYSQELFANLYVNSYDIDVCMIRMFNLGGSGQKKGYMITDFSSGIADIEKGKSDRLVVGNLSSARDFTHVKDACRAIRMIVEKGHKGEIYNICSGKVYTAQNILDRLIQLSSVPIAVFQDPMKMRPSDTPIVCGNHDKLTSHTGWVPEFGIDDILKDALEYWRNFDTNC